MPKITSARWRHDGLSHQLSTPIDVMNILFQIVWRYPEFPSRQRLNLNHIEKPEIHIKCPVFRLKRQIMPNHWSVSTRNWIDRILKCTREILVSFWDFWVFWNDFHFKFCLLWFQFWTRFLRFFYNLIFLLFFRFFYIFFRAFCLLLLLYFLFLLESFFKATVISKRLGRSANIQNLLVKFCVYFFLDFFQFHQNLVW